jgi:hypothetical protein
VCGRLLQTSAELEQLLGRCDAQESSLASRLVASAELAADPKKTNAKFWPQEVPLPHYECVRACVARLMRAEALCTLLPQGAQLVSLTCEDFQFVNVSTKAAIQPKQLEYPVRAAFSSKLRPPKFRGKIEFRDVNFRCECAVQ